MIEEVMLEIILALFFAKLIGGLLERWGFVELLGAIIAGMILANIGLVHAENLEVLARIGLILILFLAGFEIRLSSLWKEKEGFVFTGLVGSLIPFIIALYIGIWSGFSFISSFFLATAVSATSVSVSVSALISEGKINSKLGRYVISSSVIDDVISLIMLVLAVSIAEGGMNIITVGIVFIKVMAFTALFLVAIYTVPKLLKSLFKIKADEIELSISIVFILFLAYLAEVFGLSSIMGSFLAGIILGRVRILRERIMIHKFEALSYGFFVPIFFAWMGMQFSLQDIAITPFVVIITITSLLSKVIASWISSMPLRFKEWLALGVARIPRGEVSLTVIALGAALGVVGNEENLAVLFLTLISIIITPLILKPLLSKGKRK